jgi:hypothetical protein
VEYIVLPTFAYEHKIFCGPFSRRFPKAQVWVAPRWAGGWVKSLQQNIVDAILAGSSCREQLATGWSEEIAVL